MMMNKHLIIGRFSCLNELNVRGWILKFGNLSFNFAISVECLFRYSEGVWIDGLLLLNHHGGSVKYSKSKGIIVYEDIRFFLMCQTERAIEWQYLLYTYMYCIESISDSQLGQRDILIKNYTVDRQSIGAGSNSVSG